MIKFGSQLQSWLIECDISRKTLIALLQNRYYREFGGLDAITLSRWVNGKSTPALYKQLLIAKVLNRNHIDYLKNVANQRRCSQVITESVDRLTKSLDLSLNVLSYKNVPSQAICEIVRQTNIEHSKQFENFYSNVSALKGFRQELLKLDNCNHHTILLKNKHRAIIGHWSSIIEFKAERLSSLPTAVKSNYQRACFFQLGYFTNSEQLFQLIVAASCLYLFQQWAETDVAYVFVASKIVVDFCTLAFGAEVIKYYRPTSTGDKLAICLLKIDIAKVISSPIILPKIVKKLNCITNCTNCGLCNLKDYVHLV